MLHRKLTFEELKKLSLDLESKREISHFPIYVILENIRSLYNVGSIFRSADALRVEKLILTGFTGRPPRKEINKVALGSVESVNWIACKKSSDAICDLRSKGIQIIALEQTADSIDFQEFSYAFPAAIILGNEYDGILQETLEMCDACVEIPMMGIKQSLNVSTAFGIIGYELFRRLRR